MQVQVGSLESCEGLEPGSPEPRARAWGGRGAALCPLPSPLFNRRNCLAAWGGAAGVGRTARPPRSRGGRGRPGYVHFPSRALMADLSPVAEQGATPAKAGGLLPNSFFRLSAWERE